MSPILFFIIFFICTGVGKIFLQINSAAVAFIDILIAAWEGLTYPFFIRKRNHSKAQLVHILKYTAGKKLSILSE